MKRIHLLRHAKSSWGDASLADVDRPLNPRGLDCCRLMARPLVEVGCSFENVFCSPAVRAQSTIRLISENLSGINVEWQTDPTLYTFDSEDLHDWCRAIDDSISEILIVGHNPAFTEFCNELSGSDLRNIPTCGYVQLTATQVCTWKNISGAAFELTTFLRPKDLMER